MYEGSQTPTPAEERVTAVCGMEVRAAATGEGREPIAGFDRVRIAVVLKVRGRNRMLVPCRDELHEQPHRGRGENAVRPYDLGPPPGGTVSAHLVGDALPVEDTHAPQAVLARSREGDLSADNELVAHLMHVHSDINEGKEESAGKLLKLIALGKRVHTTEQDVACAQLDRAGFPSGFRQLTSLTQHAVAPRILRRRNIYGKGTRGFGERDMGDAPSGPSTRTPSATAA